MKATTLWGPFSIALLALAACSGGSKEKVTLSYAGDDARNTTDALSAAITEAGKAPSCKDRKFCKFKYDERGTVHYKLTKKDPTLVLEIADDVEEGERFKLEQEMTSLAQEIWTKATGVAIAKEDQQKQAAADEKAREDANDIERERIAAAERVERDKIAAENQKQVEVKAQADAEAAKVYDTISFEAKTNGGAALKVETPEGAVCTTISDNTAKSKSLEVPFQIETTPGSYYTVECVTPAGSAWRKKVQTKERFVTVVQLRQGSAK